MNGPIKIVLHYIGLERLENKNTAAYWAHSYATKKIKYCYYNPLVLYSQHFILFITYEWAQ